MKRDFAADLRALQTERHTTLALCLNPRLTALPLPIQRYDEPLLPFGKAIIDATHDLVCAYVFDLAAYLALGAAGAVALERTIAYAGAGRALTILHGPFATPDYAAACGPTALAVDAATVTDDRLIDVYRSAVSAAFVVQEVVGDTYRWPRAGGVYLHRRGLFLLRDTSQGAAEGDLLRVRVLGEPALYAGRGDDFTAQVRAHVAGQRAGGETEMRRI